jgi:DnaJ-domain-containing protein 1
MEVGSLEWMERENKLLEAATREHARKEGEIKQIKKQLKELFGVSDPDKLKELVEKTEREVEELQAKHQKALKAYLKVRGDVLGVTDD